jgi:hypothetical protein
MLYGGWGALLVAVLLHAYALKPSSPFIEAYPINADRSENELIGIFDQMRWVDKV